MPARVGRYLTGRRKTRTRVEDTGALNCRTFLQRESHMKSRGWTRGLALLTVFAIGCSDMTTSPLPLATRSKPIYIDIAGTWESSDSSGFTVVISDVTNPDTVSGTLTSVTGATLPFDAVRDGGDRSNVVWTGILDNGGAPFNVVLTLVNGHYKPATHMVMTTSLHGFFVETFELVRVKHT